MLKNRKSILHPWEEEDNLIKKYSTCTDEEFMGILKTQTEKPIVMRELFYTEKRIILLKTKIPTNKRIILENLKERILRRRRRSRSYHTVI